MDDSPAFAEQCPSLLPAGDNPETAAVSLRRSLTILGSREDAHVQLKSHTVSRAHAVIVLEPGRACVHDLASREGVLVNGQRIRDAALKDGDEVHIGRFKFIFKAGGVDPSPGPAKPAPAAHLRIKGDTLPLTQQVTSIGRRQGMDVMLDNEEVSSTHALIYLYQGQHLLHDLNSRTGTLVNGKLSRRKIELRDGDVIRIGPTTMHYVLESPIQVGLSPQQAVELPMNAALIEVAEMARQITAQIETQSARLSALLDNADRRIDQLQSLSQQPAAVGGGNTAANTHVDAAQPSPRPPEPEDERHRAVYDLADRGLSPLDIATRLNRLQGEIELILALRRM